MHRFVADGEKLSWQAAAAAVANAASNLIANVLVKRDGSGDVEVNQLKAKALRVGGNNGETVLAAHPNAGNVTLTLPESAGAAEQVLATDGNGVLRWKDVSSQSIAVRDSARNLMMRNAVNAPTSAMQISADEMMLQNASGVALQVFSINLTAEISASLDTGSVQSSRWYHVWITSDGQNVGALYSLSQQTPAVSPALYKAYVGAVYNDANGNLVRIIQRGKRVLSASRTVLQEGISPTYAEVSLAQAVPSNASVVFGEAGVSQDFSVYAQGIYISADNTGLGEVRYIQYTEGGLTDDLSWQFSAMLASPQSLYYQCYHKLGPTYCALDRTHVFIKIKGWEYP
jgi:hypothetical protein